MSETLEAPDTTENPAELDRYAVLFADIVGSSKLYVQLGNASAQREIDRLLTIMIHVVQKHGGQLVKTIGDEIMVTFEDPEQAAEAAIALNLKIQDENQSVRTGMSYGPLIFDGPDVFGNTVNRAASLVRAAHSVQILVDCELFEYMPYWLLNYCDMYDRLVLKGSESKATVYRLNWQSDDSDLNITQVNGGLIQSQITHNSKLELTIGTERYIHHASDEPLTIGRDPAISLCTIAHPCVSRLHCVIAYNRGKFIFEDRSTNGSYLQERGQPQLYLRKESAPLLVEGSITLGQSEADSLATLHFKHIKKHSDAD